jgi:hypothetical protein
MDKKAFIGLDVHKDSISVSIAEEGRNGPVRFLGAIPNSVEAGSQDGKTAFETWRAGFLL